MATYKEQLDVLDPIKLSEGQTRRINCPFCGGQNTFSISRHAGSRVWNCYKASCGIRGGKDTEQSLNTIRERLKRSSSEEPTFDPLPEHLSRPQAHKRVMEYLEAVGSLEAFEAGLVDIKFSPQENRVLFLMNAGSGAVGRALDRRKPKWKVFGDSRGLLSVGVGTTAVLVEDAASACSMGVFSECSGCALLGTSVTLSQKRQLMSYEKVIIALDKDASRKALELQRQLEGRVLTRVVYLEDDLKYLTRQQRERILR